MAGKVYVFNCYNEPVQLVVNGFAAGAIPSWGSTGASIYQPQSIALGRVKASASGPQFASGNNACRAQWDSFAVTVNVGIPSQGVSLDDDLLLYLFVNQSLLASTRGLVLQAFPNNRIDF